ncbi:MAG: hypothetical protein ACE366_30560 [Bradymonadia bacterium]
MHHDDLIDLVADLQHDLGKYLRQPLAFLPAEATDGEVREALETAIKRTRRTPRGVRGAHMIWQEIVDEGGETLRAFSAFAPLEAAVRQALGWEASLADSAPIDRQRALDDMSAVADAIRDLADEVHAR